MSDLLKINVNDHTERKNGLTYLSWAWAWAEVLKIDPKARWHAVEYSNERGCALPAMFLPDGSAMVKVECTIKGETKTCLLPVMNHRNQAIKNPDAFAINTAVMRCLAKAISMHGLGLYIYAGEDLPEDEEVSAAPKQAVKIPARPPTEELGLSAETLRFIDDLVLDITEMCKEGQAKEAVLKYKAAGVEGDEHIAFQNKIDSKTRTALRLAQEQLKKEPA